MEPDAPPLHFINDRKQEDGFDFRAGGPHRRRAGRQARAGRRGRLRGPARSAARRRDRRHHGRLRARSVDRGRGLVERLPRLRPVPDRARGHGRRRSGRSRDLAGKRIAIYDDPAAERWVQQNIPNARISKFSGDDGWFEAVERDQADALIYDYPFAAEEIKAHPRTIIVQYNLNQSKYAVGDPGRQLRPGLRGEPGDRPVPRHAAVRRPDARVPVERRRTCSRKPVAGRKTYTVKAGDTLSKIAAGAAEGLEPLARDLGSQPRARRQREPDLPAARAADALSRAEGARRAELPPSPRLRRTAVARRAEAG